MIILVNGFKDYKLYFLFDGSFVFCAVVPIDSFQIWLRLVSCSNSVNTLCCIQLCNIFATKETIIYIASIGVCNCLHWTKLMSLGKMRWYLPECLILAGWAVQGGLLGATFSWEFVGNESKGGGFCQHCAPPRTCGVKMVSLVLRVILESRIGRLTACASWKEDSDG